LDPEAAGLLVLLLAVPAGDPTGPWARWHFVFSKETEMSVLFRRDAGGDETRLLLRCDSGRFELVSRQDPSGRDSTESVRSLEEGEALSRRLLFAFSSREEIEPACRGVAPGDACVVFSGKNGSLAAPLSAFSGTGSAALRDRGAALVSPGMKKRLCDLGPLLTFAAEFGSYTGDFLGLLWPEVFARPLGLRRGTRTRGCDFDAGFGHPCTAAEREREERRLGPDAPRPFAASPAPPTGTPPHRPRE
jgi:hypothetical protein